MPGDADRLVELLVRAVPAAARSVVLLGRGDEGLAAALARRSPAPAVHRARPDGTGPDTGADVAPGSADCLVCPDLGALGDPVAALRSLLPLLSEDATVVCAARNLQYAPVLTEVLRGTFRADSDVGTGPSGPEGRLLTYAELLQLLLDASLLPDLVPGADDDVPDELLDAGAPLFELLDIDTADLERHLRSPFLVARASVLPAPPADDTPLTFVCCVNDERQLHANLLHSPCLRPGSHHEVLLFRGCASAAEGLNAGIAQARNELVVLVHQDVYLPDGWPARVVSQWRRAAASGSPPGLAGVFGVADRTKAFDAIGRVVHRDRLLREGTVPAAVDGLDEVVLVVPRGTPLRVDPDVGWHLYGTDLSLQADTQGLAVLVLDAPCHHNTSTTRIPVAYRTSEVALARKWRDRLPVHTNLSSIGAWLLEAPTPEAADAGPETSAVGVGSPALAELVRELRHERAALCSELEKSRLRVASMEASPAWRARELLVGIRARLTGRRGAPRRPARRR